MGNKLSCSCAPLIKKTGYRCEDSPWNPGKKRDGHLLRLWAEVFHVSSSGAGTVKWQQVSEDLVPVNITCIQETPECVFHITAYNSQVEKILDVRLIQPGTRIGQASECFVYWKDPATNDTWGLNFTSPIDARAFRECCSPQFKFSRKTPSTYSLKLDHPRGGQGTQTAKGATKAGRRKPVSTPASPSRTGREPQCTCMTAEQYSRLKAQDPRFKGTSTLPRSSPGGRVGEGEGGPGGQTAASHGGQPNINVRNQQQQLQQQMHQHHQQQSSIYDTVSSRRGTNAGIETYGRGGVGSTGGPRSALHSSQISLQQQQQQQPQKSNLVRRDLDNRSGGDNRSLRGSRRDIASKSVDYSEMETVRDSNGDTMRRRARSRSTDDVNKGNSEAEPNNNQTTNDNESPTTHLLQEYEMHLRNTLAKGMDAESYSLHTFEQLLSHSTEDLENAGRMDQQQSLTLQQQKQQLQQHYHNKLQQHLQQKQLKQQQKIYAHQQGPHVKIHPPSESEKSAIAGGGAAEMLKRPMTSGGATRGSDRSLSNAGIRGDDREPSGYFSDRNESFGSRRDLYDRGYTSDRDHDNRRYYDRQDSIRSGYNSDHERGYASDRDARGGYMSDRDQRGYMSDRDRGYMSDRERGGYMSNRERGYYSDRERGYVSDREQRGYVSDRDTRGYASDRERGYYSDREHTALMAQASTESADSRLCYLTSSEISDDDRMSLTTAVSEDEEGESNDTSPYKGSRGGTTAASFNCTGAVRKAGFLSVKKWLLRKKHQIELARKRGWKGYWVCLKGTTLLFYPCDSREGRSVEAAPKHLIIVDGAIMQPVPEHPKRDYIFCLSTAFGDAYLFQAPCQVELENWVNSIHSACAAAFARHRGKTGTLHLLQEEIFRIDRAIESDSKLKHMAELQLSVVSDMESKQQILGQIQQWEENLERLHCEQFRLRCYMSSLQNGELPNPKGLLMHVSRSTKGTLNRLGVFTVSSFHAYICARSPSLLNNLLAGRGATKRRAPMLSRSNSVSSRRSLQLQSNHEPDKVYKVSLPDNQVANITLREAMSVEEFLVAASSGRGLNPMEHFVRVKKRRELEETNYFVPHRTDLIENYLATHEVVEICAKILYQVELSRSSLDHMWGFSVEAELIENSERQDELCCYISRVEDRSTAMTNGIIKSDEIMVINGAIVSDLDMMYIESVLQEELALCLMMRSSRTEPPDLASLMKTTDEIIESLVCPPPPSESSLNEEMISSMIVPAPSWSKQHHQSMGGGSIHGSMGHNMGMGGMGPGPMDRYNGMSGYGSMGHSMGGMPQHQQMMQYGKGEPASPDGFPPPASDSSDRSNVSSLEIESFLKGSGGGNTSDLSGCSRSPVDNRLHHGGDDRRSSIGGGSVVGVGGSMMDRCSPTGSLASSHSQSQLTPSRQLSHAERLRKVLSELVETEASYVKHLNNLLENYLEPLRNASFLTSAEVTALFGNIREIVAFQRLFLQALREAIDIEPDFNKFDQPYEFKTVLVSIASAFLYYASQFKLYSSFCASHSKAQKVLHPSEGNQALKDFLASRNPRQQHSSTLESYLIKPIQRILKYPLLLQQLKNLTEPGTDENRHLVEALVVMEKVAEHINEMQRIHEEYGAIFDHLFRQHQKTAKLADNAKPVDLSPGDLIYYGGVEWLNISDFLGKIKKGLELHAMCFVFKSAVVFLCKERLRQKKKLMGGGSGKNNSSEVEIIRYQVLIPVTEVQVRASPMKDMDNHFLWELIHLKNNLQRRSEKVYHLSNSTSEFRNAFLKTIRQIIRESVRNMSIPNKIGGGGRDGAGSGGSGGSCGGGRGSTGGSMSSLGSGGGSSRSINANTMQCNRGGGGNRKKQNQNQSGTLNRHSAAMVDYGSDTLESYDNVPETHQNGHHKSNNMGGGASGYRNRGKMGSDATDEQSDSTTKSDPAPQPHQKILNNQQQQAVPQQQQQQQLSPDEMMHHRSSISSGGGYQDRSERSDRSGFVERASNERSSRATSAERNRSNRGSTSGSIGAASNSGYDSRGGEMSSSRSSSRQRGGRESAQRSEYDEDDMLSGAESRRRAALGRTPNHLSLSTSSTLSTTSTGSQAKLIQSSNTPMNFQTKSSSKPGSPVWKQRDTPSSRGSSTSLAAGVGNRGVTTVDIENQECSMTLPRAGKTFNTFGRGDHMGANKRSGSGANISNSMSGSISGNIGGRDSYKHHPQSLQGSTRALNC